MATKRKYNLDEDDDNNLQEIHVSNKKHTLDSDEEDSDEYEKEELRDSDIEGEEEGESKIQDEVKITPFNMREELEEGHFDKEGHYHWNKSDDIKDNWLDNIDWVRIEKDKKSVKEGESKQGESGAIDTFNQVQLFKELLKYMNKGESVAETLHRLGKNRVKMSSVERLKLKKQGFVDECAEKITKFTELANEILTRTGNMDVYQLTYESINAKVGSMPNKSNDSEPGFDMYSDDFNEKEKTNLIDNTTNNSTKQHVESEDGVGRELLWEFKWKEEDTELQGPYDTRQMLQWSQNGYFKNGVYVRKVGEITSFYTSNRIDFDLYL